MIFFIRVDVKCLVAPELRSSYLLGNDIKAHNIFKCLIIIAQKHIQILCGHSTIVHTRIHTYINVNKLVNA